MQSILYETKQVISLERTAKNTSKNYTLKYSKLYMLSVQNIAYNVV